MLVVAPHALRAPWWLTLLTLCLYAWRLYFALNRAPLPSRWLVLGVAAVAMLGVWIEYRTLFGRAARHPAAGAVLGPEAARDAHAIATRRSPAFLGYFLIVTNFLYTQIHPDRRADGRGAVR